MTKSFPVLPVSLIVVSDYVAEGNDEELRRSLWAYAADPAGVPAEIIVMAPAGFDIALPAFPESAPDQSPIFVHTHATDESSQLKDAGLAHCRHALVAVVEADCLPEPGWLKALTDAMQDDASIDVVSGRTIYGRDGMLLRVMSLMDRGFIEPRSRGQIIHVSNNGALYRRDILERYKYEAGCGPFVSAHLRQQAMLADGVTMAIAPAAVSVHAFGGWKFLWDVRRNKGYQFARMMVLRQKPAQTKLGLALHAIGFSFRSDRRTALAVWGNYCKWSDWPLFVAMMFAVRVPEFLGALAAHDPEAFKASTAYR